MIVTPSIEKSLMKLEDIYTSLRINNIYFSKNEAVKIVGSRTSLERLISQGRIRVHKMSDRQQALLKCNAEDVLRFSNYNN